MLVWVIEATRCIEAALRSNAVITRYVGIKTRCTQCNVTWRRVIEASSPHHDALMEKNMQQQRVVT